MDEKEIKEAIEFYRALVEDEIKKEKLVDDKLIGPRELAPERKIKIEDITHPLRPFLGKEVGEDKDSTYVTTFRMGTFNLPEYLAKSCQGTTFVGGLEFGSNLVKQNLINNIEDLVQFLVDFKIGIVDLFKEEEVDGEKRLDIRVYECIDCSGLPNIGEPNCFFETGIITGVLKELTKKEVFAEEIRCWTSGYSFCHFEVKIKDGD
jgi:uncharacterized protein